MPSYSYIWGGIEMSKKREKFLDRLTLEEFKELVKKNPQEILNDGPCEIISGSGTAWYYDPLNRIMSQVDRGSAVTTLSVKQDNKGRLITYFHIGKILLVPKEEIIEIGYN